MRIHQAAAAFIVAMSYGAAAAAQPAGASPPAAVPTTGWSATAGYEVFEFRDISRNMDPPDASPVTWRGEGPAMTVKYEHGKGKGRHIADASFAQSGGFEYVSPTRATLAPSADHGSRFEARYEYRRYFWRDLGVDGLDLGGGVQGIYNHRSFERHVSAAAQTSTTMGGGGFAFVVAAAWRRWDRVQARIAWANGAVNLRRTTEHSFDPAAVQTANGGYYVGDLDVAADVRLSPAVRLTAGWRRWAGEYSSNHMAFSERRNGLTIGVTYGR